jgi:hypothetical protein
MDLVLGRLAQVIPESAPPSRIDEIESSLNKAIVLLSKGQPTDADLQAAQVAAADASTRVDTLNQRDQDFGQKLAQRILEVKADVDAIILKSPTLQRVSGSAPGAYQALQTMAPGTAEIAAPWYFSLDMATEKILLIRSYVRLAEGTADAAAIARLRDREKKLVDLLQLESWESLRSARLLLKEMRDDVYPERLEQALRADPQEASVDMDPAVAYDGAPLEFCVCFENTAINTSAAREEWTCDWDFGDGLKEKGWNVSHYFQLRNRKTASKFTVHTTFHNADGKLIIDVNTKHPVQVSKEVEVRPTKQPRLLGERSITEGLKLTAALLIAVFGLVAGARDQLLKLDVLPGLVAVFLVGFGADTIKNLLTSKS